MLTGVIVSSQSHLRRMKKRRATRSTAALPDSLETLDSDHNAAVNVRNDTCGDLQSNLTFSRYMLVFYEEGKCKLNKRIFKSHQRSMSFVRRAVIFPCEYFRLKTSRFIALEKRAHILEAILLF